MKCLVTGAAGFIGSHLCEELIAQGHEVIGLDDLSTGFQRNLDSIKENKRFKFKKCNILNFNFERIFPVDWIFHLAGKADLIPSINDPGLYHETNVNGTFGMLQLAKLYPCKKFVYAASSTCYGIPRTYPTPETEPLWPRHPYGLTKKIGEDYVMHWSAVYGIPAISLRLFNVYGPRARTNGAYGAMFGTFLAQIANSKPVTIVGDGSQKRDFTFVTDVARAFIKAAESKCEHAKINIGTGRPYSVNEIVQLLRPIERVHIPKRPGEPDITHAETTLAKTLLQWEPKISIEQGVRLMKDRIQEFKSAPVWEPNSIKKATAQWFEYLS